MRPRPLITSLMRGLLSFVMTVIEVLIFLRLVFMLLGANTSNAIVAWVYRTSSIFVGPFDGIFNDIVIDGKYVIDINALVAWFVYLLIYIGLIEVIKVIERALMRP